MQSIKHPLIVVALVGLAFYTSCKKSDVITGNLTPPTTTSSPSGTTADALKDSALLYSKDIYLWYNQIPSSFNARSYSDIDKLMTAIRQ
jgi:carboxyl-terminal processing protease